MKTHRLLLAAVASLLLALCLPARAAVTITNINLGSAANDGTGDSLRSALTKVMTNFHRLNHGKIESTNGAGTAGDVLTSDGTNWYGAAPTGGTGAGAFTNASMIFSNTLIINPTSTTSRLNGLHLTNQVYPVTAGTLVDVQPGTYWVGTNFASLLKNGVNLHLRPGATIISGTAGEADDIHSMFHDTSGAITSSITGAGTFIVSNDFGHVLELSNVNSKVYFEFHRIYNANNEAAVIQTTGGGELTLVSQTDGIYSQGYDAFISSVTNGPSNPNLSKIFIDVPNLIGDTNAGDSAFEFAGSFALPGRAFIRAKRARGDVTLVDGLEAEIGSLDLGAANVIYSPLRQVGSGILRNAYVYGTSNRTVSLIQTPNNEDGGFATAATFDDVTFIGPTNRPIATITNDSGSITFNGGRFYDGFGATNSIRSRNAQNVTLNNLKLDLGLHSNVTASGATNFHSTIRAAKSQVTGVATNTGVADFGAAIRAFGGLDVINEDITISGGDIYSGVAWIDTLYATNGFVLEAGAGAGKVMTSDASGIGTWQTSSGGTNNPILFSGGTLTLIANQTSRHKHSTNASFAFALSGASNQSSKVFAEFQNTSTNTIYATNSTGLYDAALSSNVTVIPIAGSSVLLMDAYLSVSNNWVADLRGARYALAFTGSGVSMGTNHTTKTVTATITGGGGTNFAGIIVSNGLERTVLWTSTTNLSLSWNAANEVIWSPVGVTASLAMTGTPGNSTNAQVINLKLRLTDSGTTSVTFPTNGIDGLAPFVLTAPSTNEFALIYDGQTFRIASYQTPSTGSGQVLVVNTNPVIWNPTIGINGASNVFTFSTPSANQVLSVHASSGGITTWTNVAPTGGGNTNLAVLATGVLDATNQIKHGSVTYSNSWQIAQEGSRSSKSATAKDGSTTIDTHGLAAFVATGTAAASSGTVSNESRVIAYSAASANADAGHEVNFPHVRPGKNNRLHGTVNLISTTNQLRMWWAFSDDALTSLSDRDMPTSKNVVGLRYNSNTNSNWWFVTSNGSSATNVDTGVPLTGEHYRARISFVETVTATTTNWVAYINGLPVATNTALLPVARMKFVGGLRTFNAASKTNAFEFLNQTSEP